MSTDRHDVVLGPPLDSSVRTPASGPGNLSRSPALEREQAVRLAHEFEAMLTTQMLQGLRKSMLSDDDHQDGLGFETMTDTMDVALGQALSRVGGFGLSTILTGALDRRAEPTTASEPVGTPALGSTGRETAPTRQPEGAGPSGREIRVPGYDAVGSSMQPTNSADDAAAVKVPGGRVSSDFGWRRNPVTGMAQFHKGIDVAQPIGQDVPSAAAGRVIQAGDQGTYGTTVVVDHGNGRQTRYAHLSAALVQVGDVVSAGQVIGKSGNSGRSTGPHLHFELIADGRVVDPRQALGRPAVAD